MDELTQNEFRNRIFRKDLQYLYDIYDEIKKDFLKDPNLNREINLEKLKFIKIEKDKLDLNEEDLKNIKERNYKSYPDYNNPNFSQVINNKAEFFYNKNDFNINSNPCSRDFELGETQIFLKNFINNRTPYKGLILYHGVGTGKTCSAITLSENFRDMYISKNEQDNKKIIILTPTDNVQQGWRRNIYDVKKGEDQCTGDIYTNIFNEEKETFNVERRFDKKINKTINKYYDFYGYGAFAGFIKRKIINRLNSYPIQDRKKNKKYIEKGVIKEHFSNKLLIIDEFHNLRSSDNDDESGKSSYKFLKKVVEHADNLRLILLSATPMYNNSEEIIWFINILLRNDNRPEIKHGDIFRGNYISKILLGKKTRGYISYLRGENPASFPIRLHPDHNKDSLCIHPNKNKEQYHDKNIYNDDEKKINFLKLYRDDFQGPQMERYIGKLEIYARNKKPLTLPEISNFKQLSNIYYPSDSIEESSKLDDAFKENNGKYSYIDKDLPFLDEEYIADYSIKIRNIIEKVKTSEGIIFIFSEFLGSGLIPLALALEHAGFKRYGHDRDLLDYPDFRKSKKTKTKKEPYHIYPHNHKDKDKQGKLELKSNIPDGEKFNQARYVLLTGNKDLSPNNDEEIDALRSDKNISGDVVKIILGSDKTAEGLDFKRIREIHVLEPWFHLNKMEQIVGRGIRFCSHEDLDKEKRNVTVYLHTGFLEDKDTVDIFIYKNAEKKAKEIGEIETILKENAVDCYLNNDINHIKKKDVNKIKLISSQNKIKVKKPFDKNNTKVCSYTNCKINCKNQSMDDSIKDYSTINYDLLEDLIKKIIKFIKELYLKNDIGVLKIDDINILLNEYIKGKYDEKLIFIALHNMIDNKTVIYNKNNKEGYIISNKDYYIFQPFNEFSKNIPLYYRKISKKQEQENKDIKSLIPKNKKTLKKSSGDIDGSESIVINEGYIIEQYNKEYPTFEELLKDNINDTDEIIHDGKPYHKNFMYYTIDTFLNKVKSKLYRYLIQKYDEYKEIKPSKNLLKSIYNYLSMNFIYNDDNGDPTEILINNKLDHIKKSPVGYYLFNEEFYKNQSDCKAQNNFKFYINEGSKYNVLKDGEIKNKIFNSKTPSKLKPGLTIISKEIYAYKIFNKNNYMLKVVNKIGKKNIGIVKLPGVIINTGNFKTNQMDELIQNLGTEEQIYSDVYIKDKPIKAIYIELILRKKNLFLSNDLFCFYFL